MTQSQQPIFTKIPTRMTDLIKGWDQLNKIVRLHLKFGYESLKIASKTGGQQSNASFSPSVISKQRVSESNWRMSTKDILQRNSKAE